MNRDLKILITGAMVVMLMILIGVACQPSADLQTMGVTNLDSLHLSDTNATATPVLRVNQAGTGKIAEFLDGNTAVWSVTDGGTIQQTGALTITGNMTITGNADEIQLNVRANSAQTRDVLVIENSAGADILQASLSQVSVDANLAVTGTSDLQGNVSDSAGSFTIADNTVISGTANAEQLLIEGSASQTNSLLVLEGTAGTDVIEWTIDGHAVADGGAVTIADNAYISATTDAEQLVIRGLTGQTQPLLILENSSGTDQLGIAANGYITSAVGDVTVDDAMDVTGDLQVTDNMTVTGDADEIQLTITGNSAQTRDVFAVENSAGADILQVSLSQVSVDANLVVTGTSDLQGNVSDSGGNFTIADNVVISGTADAEQLLIEGSASQAGSSLLVLEGAAGTDVIEWTVDGYAMSDGGAVTISDNAYISGTTDLIQLTVRGTTHQSANLMTLEDSGGTDHFTVDQGGSVMISGTTDMRGNVSDSLGNFTIADNVVISGTADAEQLLIEGSASQAGSSLLVLEGAAGTDVIEWTADGYAVSDGGAVTISDNAYISGTTDLIQLTVRGTTHQSANLMTLEDSGGTDHFTVDQGGSVMISGTTDMRGNVSDSLGNFTIADNVVISGTADAEQLLIEGSASQTNPLLVLEGTAGTDVLEISITGLLSSDTGNVTVDDSLTINDILTLTPVTWNGICDGTTNPSHPCASGVLTNTAYLFDSAGDMGIQLDTAGSTAGQVCTWTSIDAGQTISIYVGHAPGGATVQQLDDGDSATFMYSGTEWVTIAYIDN